MDADINDMNNDMLAYLTDKVKPRVYRIYVKRRWFGWKLYSEHRSRGVADLQSEVLSRSGIAHEIRVLDVKR